MDRFFVQSISIIPYFIDIINLYLMNKFGMTLFIVLMTFLTAFSQEEKVKVGVIGFYNFENLFDTVDDPKINDEEFLPESAKKWTEDLYTKKLDNLAKVVSELGTKLSPDGVAILGVSEVENRKVLEDFVKRPAVADRDYQIVHFDSPDKRGIDVALLYQKKYFKVTYSKNYPLKLYGENGKRKYTRDVLYVAGLFDGDPIHVMVNHWSSRGGGQRAIAYRNAGAAKCRAISDSIMAVNPNAKIIIIGDLNDDPSNESVKKILGAKAKKKKVKEKGFYNTMYDKYKKGFGTLAYNDAWNLFDQLIVSKGLINKEVPGYHFYQSHVYRKDYLIQKFGHFKGYPFRTFSGDNYIGGYSDHLPVYMYIVKKVL